MHISIIDDEKILSSKIRKKLESEWYAVSDFYSYSDFMKHGDSYSHLYIIDISLWDGSGFDIIRWLRTNVECNAPILIVSWYADSEKIIYGLNIWADDYLTKPFIPDELIARIKALLRRPKGLTTYSLITYKDVSFNPETQETKKWSTKIYLTHKESMILEFFMRKRWEMITREKLINSIWWGNNLSSVSDNTINVTLSRIRKKIWSELKLKTMYNHGYILE